MTSVHFSVHVRVCACACMCMCVFVCEAAESIMSGASSAYTDYTEDNTERTSSRYGPRRIPATPPRRPFQMCSTKIIISFPSYCFQLPDLIKYAS